MVFAAGRNGKFADEVGVPFDPALRDLRMNRAAARFTSRRTPYGAWLIRIGRSVPPLLRGRGGDLVCRCLGGGVLRFGRIDWGGGSRDLAGRNFLAFPEPASAHRAAACAGLPGARLFFRRGRL